MKKQKIVSIIISQEDADLILTEQRARIGTKKPVSRSAIIREAVQACLKDGK